MDGKQPSVTADLAEAGVKPGVFLYTAVVVKECLKFVT